MILSLFFLPSMVHDTQHSSGKPKNIADEGFSRKEHSDMNELQVFKHESFGNVRVIERGGEPWFVAADVCRALGVSNNRDAVAKLDDDERV